MMCLLNWSVCGVVAYLASFWNRPMFPERCRDTSLDNSLVYKTLIRSAGSWGTFGSVIQILLEKFSWHHLVVLNDNQQAMKCSNGAKATVNWLSALNYSVLPIPMNDNPSEIDLNFYLESVLQNTRGQSLKVHSE